MEFVFKKWVFLGKVIVGYKNESKRSNKELTFLKTLRSDNKNMSRNFSGAVVGSVGSLVLACTCSQGL